jgi:nucleoside-diphosphate-sugar epimerase
MSRILVSGAGGLVGQAIVATLGSRHELIGVGRQPLSSSGLRSSVVLDLTTQWSADALPARIDVVIHCAQADDWESPDSALNVFAVNTAATVRLLEYAIHAGAGHFVLMSTGGLYGSSAAPLSESSPLCPPPGRLGYYFETKRSAESFAVLYQDRLKVSILRPFFIYGAGQRAPKLVPRLIEKVKNGTVVTIRGDGGTRLNPVHVGDVVRLVDACVTQGRAGVVNVAGGQVTSVLAMVRRIGALLEKEPQLAFEPGLPEQFVADTTLMSEIIGRTPIGFDDGIGELLGRGAAR